ncbi:HD domain-containing protein [Maribellus sp. YY47]|uniref:HD domain-containing protein n=1 Tax=Maribellus sp. YY47 TaxID=2929486 RepID=UPI002000B81F|nr:HD domain-containing protein [Maribellus sp. YY47]MCK3683036.1 HD domain-containing protein [Maribellus sp. YY47]
MEKGTELAQRNFQGYFDSFSGLSEEQRNNFQIKYEHSLRVARLCAEIAQSLDMTEEEQQRAFLCGIFHDVGRFKQLAEFNTFNDNQSVDHADYSLQIVNENGWLDGCPEGEKSRILLAIEYHNKRELSKESAEKELLYGRILRDADKLDILQVITDYYTNPKAVPNHTLTWEMPKGGPVSADVARQILSGKLVEKADVANQIDIKIMQLSWVFDINFKVSFELMMKKRFMEKIYSTLPKNDTVIEVYRKVKVFAENKILG